MPSFDRHHLLPFAVVATASLGAATLAVAVLQDGLGVPNPSSLYLVAVVVTAIASGTWGAVAASVAAFLLYNFLFVAPRYTLTVVQPGELVNLMLLLFVGIVVGQLAALQRARAREAVAREREARSLFQVSRALATRSSTLDVLPAIARIVRDDTSMDRVWVTLGGDAANGRVAGDTGTGPRPVSALQQVLQRTPGDAPARWSRVHQPSPQRTRPPADANLYRVRIDAGDEAYGSLWADRPRARHRPDRTETRLLAATADQLGQALRQDRLAAEARAADLARQGEALMSSLLQSVSHDLRTPLATIRAAAGTLRPGAPMSENDQRESADAIDREVEYLNRLVTNLLDLSRIEAGVLRADRDVFELDDLVRGTLDRLGSRTADRRLEVALAPTPIEVDPIFVDAAVGNALENAVKYTDPGTRIRVATGRDGSPDHVRLTIEDGGAGVPDAALPRLFDKFYRVPGASGGSRSGTGIGLAVVRGLVEATGGRVAARRSELGGLAIDLDLPIARGFPVPPQGPACPSTVASPAAGEAFAPASPAADAAS
jgi:two-component system, OmpR family, sensor histidine kinase KdpD